MTKPQGLWKWLSQMLARKAQGPEFRSPISMEKIKYNSTHLKSQSWEDKDMRISRVYWSVILAE